MSSDCIAHKKGFQPVEAFLTCQSDSFMSMKQNDSYIYKACFVCEQQFTGSISYDSQEFT